MPRSPSSTCSVLARRVRRPRADPDPTVSRRLVLASTARGVGPDMHGLSSEIHPTATAEDPTACSSFLSAARPASRTAGVRGAQLRESTPVARRSPACPDDRDPPDPYRWQWHPRHHWSRPPTALRAQQSAARAPTPDTASGSTRRPSSAPARQPASAGAAPAGAAPTRRSPWGSSPRRSNEQRAGLRWTANLRVVNVRTTSLCRRRGDRCRRGRRWHPRGNHGRSPARQGHDRRAAAAHRA